MAGLPLPRHGQRAVRGPPPAPARDRCRLPGGRGLAAGLAPPGRGHRRPPRHPALRRAAARAARGPLAAPARRRLRQRRLARERAPGAGDAGGGGDQRRPAARDRSGARPLRRGAAGGLRPCRRAGRRQRREARHLQRRRRRVSRRAGTRAGRRPGTGARALRAVQRAGRGLLRAARRPCARDRRLARHPARAHPLCRGAARRGPRRLRASEGSRGGGRLRPLHELLARRARTGGAPGVDHHALPSPPRGLAARGAGDGAQRPQRLLRREARLPRGARQRLAGLGRHGRGPGPRRSRAPRLLR